MLSLSGNDITLTRGDSLSITIDIADSLGTPVTFETGDILYFTVKKSYSTREKSIQKKIISPSSSTIEIDILPIDTKILDYGTYYYDLQISDIHGKVFTPLLGKFIISEEVTYE